MNARTLAEDPKGGVFGGRFRGTIYRDICD